MSKEIRKFMNIINENKNINEISSDLKNRAIKQMRDRGLTTKANKWTQYYVDKQLKDFVNKEIYINNTNLIIKSFKLEDNKNRHTGNINKFLIISYGSPFNQQHNIHHGTITYNITDDEYYFVENIDRKTARILSKIATSFNPDSKYKTGTANFKIIDN